MEYFFPMLQGQTVLFLYLALGIVVRRKNIITEEAIKGIVNFILTVALPCMVLAAFFDLYLTRDLMINALTILTISTVVTLSMVPLGKLLWHRAEPGKQAVLKYGTLMPNAGFAGIPLVYTIFGTEAVFYASLYLLPHRAVTFPLAAVIFGGQREKRPLKESFLIPGNLAVFIGLLFMILPNFLPDVLTVTIETVGSIAPPLSLVAVGCMLAEVNFRRLFDKAVLQLCAVRLLLVPLLALVLLRPFGFDFILIATAVILIAMPTGVNTVLFAKQWNGDYIFAARCIFLTSLLSVITVPLLTLLL